jgi:hypothetical protein
MGEHAQNAIGTMRGHAKICLAMLTKTGRPHPQDPRLQGFVDRLSGRHDTLYYKYAKGYSITTNTTTTTL